MWISKKKWRELEKRVADLEIKAQDRSIENFTSNLDKLASDVDKAFLIAADKIKVMLDADARAGEDEMCELQKELKKLPDKILHCLARSIQEMECESNKTVKCLYCKYAPECSKEFKRSHGLLFVKLIKTLEECTSVDIFQYSTKQPNFLKGSWAEKYPDVFKMLTNKSFEEQLDSLRGPDILQCLDKHC